MEILLLSICLVNSLSVLSLVSPQWMVISLLVQVFLVVLLIGISKAIWLSYVLFLVYLGGVLIIFVYVGGLAAKVKLEYNSKGLFMLSGICLLSLFLPEGEALLGASGLLYESEVSVSGFSLVGAFWGGVVYSYTIIYLLLTLTCVCWIVKTYEGPLRHLA